MILPSEGQRLRDAQITRCCKISCNVIFYHSFIELWLDLQNSLKNWIIEFWSRSFQLSSSWLLCVLSCQFSGNVQEVPLNMFSYANDWFQKSKIQIHIKGLHIRSKLTFYNSLDFNAISWNYVSEFFLRFKGVLVDFENRKSWNISVLGL